MATANAMQRTVRPSPLDLAASRLESSFLRVRASSLLRLVIEHLYPGRVALVSSFGADAAILLHAVSQIDQATPVVFVDTGQHFPETRSPIAMSSLRLPRADQRDSSPNRKRKPWRGRIRRSCSS